MFGGWSPWGVGIESDSKKKKKGKKGKPTVLTPIKRGF